MFMFFRLVWLVAVGVGTFSCGTRSTVAHYDFAPLDSTIGNWVARGYYHGASVAVVSRGVTVFDKSYGSVTDTTRIYVASAGKWVAVAVVASVVERTPLGWDDSVGRWLPEFADDPKGSITLRQLLSHTSGVRPYLPEPEIDTFNSLAKSIAHILPLDTVFGAGSRFEYGGLGMQIAGRMAEVAAGVDFETIFQNNICNPTGMTRSHFVPVNTDGGHAPMLGGGLMTTREDYMRFLEMIFGYGEFRGTCVLLQESVQEMEADQIREAKVGRGEYVERAWGNTHKAIYGLGLWREKVDADGRAWHVSSPGWAGAYPWIDRSEGVYGFFIAHISDGARARGEGYSSFYDSPLIPRLTERILNRAEGVTQRRMCLTDGTMLYYERCGSGTPVIFLHAHSVDSRMWDGQFFGLPDTVQLIRYDLRGYGLSSMYADGHEFTHCADLLEFMDRAGIGRAHLVGLSLGAMTIVDFIALHPDRVLSATIADGGWSGPRELYIRPAIMTETLEEHRARWKNTTAAPGADMTAIHRLIDQWVAWQPQHPESGVFVGVPIYDTLKSGKISIPTLLITGRYDSQVSHAAADTLQKYLKNSQRVIIDNAGHFSATERPEEFNRTLLDFIRKNI